MMIYYQKDAIIRPAGSFSDGLRFPFSHPSVRMILTSLDLLSIVLSSIVSGFCYDALIQDRVSDVGMLLGLGAMTALVYVSVKTFLITETSKKFLFFRAPLRGITIAWTISIILMISIVFALKADRDVSRGMISLFFTLGLVSLWMVHTNLVQSTTTAFVRQFINVRRVLVLADAKELASRNIVEELIEDGFSVVDVIPLSEGPRTGQNNGSGYVSNIVSKAVSLVRLKPVDMIHVVVPMNRNRQIEEICYGLSQLPVQVIWAFDQSTRDLLDRPITQVGRFSGIEMQRAPLSIDERVAKRALDIAVASIAMVFLAPIMLMVAALIKLDSPGPVIFRQQRNGFGSRPFTIYKFRSMCVMENGASVQQATRHDARITRIGRMIRKTSIDELPQLLNVLQGHMSIVGPRPHAIAHDNEYMRKISSYAFRHHMKPGITGWAQVKGFRGETETLDVMSRRIDLDIWYVNNWSFWLDLKIILKTGLVLFFQKNAY